MKCVSAHVQAWKHAGGDFTEPKTNPGQHGLVQRLNLTKVSKDIAWQHEHEADEFGVLLAAKACYCPSGLSHALMVRLQYCME